MSDLILRTSSSTIWIRASSKPTEETASRASATDVPADLTSQDVPPSTSTPMFKLHTKKEEILAITKTAEMRTARLHH